MPIITDQLVNQVDYTISDITKIDFQPGNVTLRENLSDIDFYFNFDGGVVGQENLLLERSGKPGLDGTFNVTPTRVVGKINSAVVFPTTPRTYTNHGVPNTLFNNADKLF